MDFNNNSNNNNEEIDLDFLEKLILKSTQELLESDEYAIILKDDKKKDQDTKVYRIK